MIEQVQYGSLPDMISPRGIRVHPDPHFSQKGYFKTYQFSQAVPPILYREFAALLPFHGWIS
jgi:hypothetical protein